MKTHKPTTNNNRHTLYQPRERVIPLKSYAWKKLRARVLLEEPLCRSCLEDYDIPTPAVDVDHSDGNPNNNARDNLVPLCHSCHSQKTRDEMLERARVHRGCDVNGIPLDPNHHWNQPRKSPETEPKSTTSQPLRTRAQVESFWCDEDFG